MLRSLRAVFAMQSVTPTVVANMMSKVRALSCPRKGLPLHACSISKLHASPTGQLNFATLSTKYLWSDHRWNTLHERTGSSLVLMQSLTKAVVLLYSACEGQAKHPLLIVQAHCWLWRGGGLHLKELRTALSQCHIFPLATALSWQWETSQRNKLQQ